MASQPDKANDATRVFISYSRSDQDRVDLITDALSADGKFQVYIDQSDILPSEEWKPRLEKLIRASDAVVFVLSPRSVASEVCDWELACATEMSKRVIPLVIEEADGPVPDALSRLNYLFADAGRDFDEAMGALKSTLNTDIDWLREHTRMGELADRWQKVEELGVQPLRGRELEAAELWMLQRPFSAPEPTSAQRKYIYDSRKLASRRQRWAISGALSLTGVLAVMAAFAWTQRTAAIEGQEKAEAALREANRAARTMTQDLAADLQASRVPRAMVRSILEKSLELQDSLTENFPDDVPLQKTQMTSRVLVAKVLEQQNDDASALDTYRQALDTAQRLAALPDATINTKSYIPLIWMHIGALHMSRDEYPDAQEALSRSVELYRGTPDGQDMDRTRRFRLAEGLTFLATTYLNTAQYAEADTMLAEAVMHYRELIATTSSDPSIYEDWPHTLRLAAQAKHGIGDANAAEALYIEAVEAGRRVFEKDQNNSRAGDAFLSALSDLGDFRIRQGKPAAAEVFFREALQVAKDGFEVDQTDVSTIEAYTVMLDRVSKMAEDRGNIRDALDLKLEALDLERGLLAGDPKNVDRMSGVQYLLGQIGYLYVRLYEPNNAIDFLQASLDALANLSVHLKGDQFVARFDMEETLVRALYSNKEPERARDLNDQLRADVKEKIAAFPDDLTLTRYLAMAAMADANHLADAKKKDEALPLLRESVKYFGALHSNEGNPVAYGRDYQIALNQLGNVMIQLEQPQEALSVLEQAREVIDEVVARNPDNDLWQHDIYVTLRYQAAAYEQLGELSNAYDKRLEVVELLEDLISRSPEKIAWIEDLVRATDEFAMLHFNNNYYEDSASLFETLMTVSQDFLEQFPGNQTFTFYRQDSQEYLALSLGGWSDQLLLEKEFGEAVETAERALQLKPDDLVIKSFLANAYMLNGNTAQARSLYLSHRGAVFESGLTWEDSVRSDFKVLQSNGLARPLMDEILSSLEDG